MSISHHCGEILVNSSLPTCFNSVILEGFCLFVFFELTACLRLCRSISIRFKSDLWLGHSFWLNIGGLSGVFQIIVLLLNFSAVDLQGTNWWSDILLWDFRLESRMHCSINHSKSPMSYAAKQPQTIKLLPPCLAVEMMFFHELLLWQHEEITQE